MKLALALGLPLRDTMERIDSAEFTLWLAYYGIEPFGQEIEDMRAGIVASTIANCHASRGKSFKPSDFMIKRGPEEDSVGIPKAQSEMEMLAILSAFGSAQNAHARAGG